MSIGEVVLMACGASFGVAAFGVLFLMLIHAIRTGELSFHGGELHGWPARLVGVIGVLGFASALYLLFGFSILHTEPPGTPVAISLICLAALVLITLRGTSILWWRHK